MSPRERFTALKERLGDAFEVIEIDSRPGNEHGFGKMAHSVLTDEVREVDGQPAYEARKRVVEFLTQRLGQRKPEAHDSSPMTGWSKPPRPRWRRR